MPTPDPEYDEDTFILTEAEDVLCHVFILRSI